MPDDKTSLRFNWRMHPRPTPRAAEEPAPSMLEPSNITKWPNQQTAAYVDGMNWYTVGADNPINAVNPFGG